MQLYDLFQDQEAFTFASSTTSSVSNFVLSKTDKVRSILIRNSLKTDLRALQMNFLNS
jgi:hypothetical protein